MPRKLGIGGCGGVELNCFIHLICTHLPPLDYVENKVSLFLFLVKLIAMAKYNACII
jgi:hypothetical protein